ncbi:hypothetical protein F5Y10DRAFT_194992 [Nemania abortiva]|nr:hypothetical protein F5Y10DRAFT_194992 [Nemania abortiva]
MAVTRPALSAAGCSQCRFLVLNLFTSSALRSAPIARPPLFHARARAAGALPMRRFSSLPKPPNPTLDAEHGQNIRVLEEEQGKDQHEDEHEDEGKVKDEAATSDSKATEVPWYLQVEPPTHVAPLEPPPLPETPPDAPPLIRLLLEYASEEMGLDELSLLDLRKLDPPPALGPNLFMLFGTARSERHLNVSAGRLVRWLRAKHRVHADADGLLGPNERKTKLRRKARRAKLLGTMGTDDADDGIRTGWICVNLGTIDRGGVESTVVAEDGRVSGFGISHIGSTIVFQIMTEGRRAEMGLEELWTRALDRSISPPSKSGSADDGEDSKSRARSEKVLHPVEKAMMAGLHRPSGFPSSRKGQYPKASPPNQAHFYSTQQLSTPSAADVDPLSTSSPEELARVLSYDTHQKQRLLELLRVQLDAMDAGTARIALGKSDMTSQATPFMELMELAIETLPPTQTWGFRLAVQHKASVSELPNINESLENVRLLVDELRIYGIKATRDQYLQLLSYIFCAKGQESTDALNLALDVINTMQQRNELTITSDLIVTIIEGASKSKNKHSWTKGLIARLETLLSRLNLPYMGEQLVMRLMTAHASQSDWDGVWNDWGIPARNLRARSAGMYVHMYQLAVATGNYKVCSTVLRRCAPESMVEDPPVFTDRDVSQAALKCISIADPLALGYAEELPEDSRGHLRKLADREFVKLARLLKSSA